MTAVVVPESVAIARPNPALIQSAERYLALARESYSNITTAEQYAAAGEDLRGIKAAQKSLEDERNKVVKPLNDVLNVVRGWFKPLETMLAEAEKTVKSGQLAYIDRQEAERRKAEAAAAETARKERERLEAQAAKAEASGKVERAEALRMTAAAIPERVEIATSVPRVAGQAVRSTWKAEVTNKLALVKYIAEHPEWLHLVEVNATALNGLARTQKSALALPGVKAVEERGLAQRAA